MNQDLWRNTKFLGLFLSYGISSFGDWFDMMAVMTLFAYVWHASPMLVAAVSLTYAVPSVLLSQIAGVFADRWKKVHIMLSSDVLRCFFTLLLMTCSSPYWALVILTFRSVVSVVHSPAQQSLVVQVVSNDQILAATSVNKMVFQLSKVFGPMLGASLLSFSSPKICIFMNALSFLVSAMILAGFLRIQENQVVMSAHRKGEGFLAQWMEGWHVLLSKRILLMSTLLFFVGFFVVTIADSQMSVLMRYLVPNHPQWLGYLLSTIGMGTLVVVLILSRFTAIRSFGWVVGGGSVLNGAGLVGLGLLHPPAEIWRLIVAAFIEGVGVGMALTGINYFLQTEAPEELLGRVNGIVNSLMSLAAVVAPMVGGMLSVLDGPRGTYEISGIITVVLSLMVIVFEKPLLLRDAQAMSGQ